MVKSNLKEEERIAENIRKFPKKSHGVKFSLLNEIPNIHILFENVIFVKFGGNA